MGEEAGRNSIPNNAALDPSLQTYWSLQWKLPMHSPLPDSRCGWVESRSAAPPMGRSFPSISDPQHPSRKVSKHLVRLRLFYPWFHPPNPYRMILLISDSPEGPLPVAQFVDTPVESFHVPTLLCFYNSIGSNGQRQTSAFPSPLPPFQKPSL